MATSSLSSSSSSSSSSSNNDGSDAVLRRIPNECAKFVMATNRVVHFDESLRFRLGSDFCRPLPQRDLNHPDILHSISNVRPTQSPFVPMLQLNNNPLRVQTQRNLHVADNRPVPTTTQPSEESVHCDPDTTTMTMRHEEFIPTPGFFDQGGPSVSSSTQVDSNINISNFIFEDPQSLYPYNFEEQSTNSFHASNFEEQFNQEVHVDEQNSFHASNFEEQLNQEVHVDEQNSFHASNFEEQSNQKGHVDEQNPFHASNFEEQSNQKGHVDEQNPFHASNFEEQSTNSFHEFNFEEQSNQEGRVGEQNPFHEFNFEEQSNQEGRMDEQNTFQSNFESEEILNSGFVVIPNPFQSSNIDHPEPRFTDHNFNQLAITTGSIQEKKCHSEIQWMNGKVAKAHVEDVSATSFSKLSLGSSTDTPTTVKTIHNLNMQTNNVTQSTWIKKDPQAKKNNNVEPIVKPERVEPKISVKIHVKKEVRRTHFSRDDIRKIAQKYNARPSSSNEPQSPRKRSSEPLILDTTPPQSRRRSETFNVVVTPKPKQRQRAESFMNQKNCK